MLAGEVILIVAAITATVLFNVRAKKQKEEICALRIYIYEHCQDEMEAETLEKYIRIWRNQNRR